MKKRITLSLTLALSVVAVVLAATVIFSGGSRALPTDSENSFASEAIIFACKNGLLTCHINRCRPFYDLRIFNCLFSYRNRSAHRGAYWTP